MTRATITDEDAEANVYSYFSSIQPPVHSHSSISCSVPKEILLICASTDTYQFMFHRSLQIKTLEVRYEKLISRCFSEQIITEKVSPRVSFIFVDMRR